MEAGCFRAVDMDEAMDRPSGAVEGGARGALVSVQARDAGGLYHCDPPSPPPFEEPGWPSWGQEEASKLSHSLTFLQLLVQQPADIKAFMPL